MLQHQLEKHVPMDGWTTEPTSMTRNTSYVMTLRRVGSPVTGRAPECCSHRKTTKPIRLKGRAQGLLFLAPPPISNMCATCASSRYKLGQALPHCGTRASSFLLVSGLGLGEHGRTQRASERVGLAPCHSACLKHLYHLKCQKI